MLIAEVEDGRRWKTVELSISWKQPIPSTRVHVI